MKCGQEGFCAFDPYSPSVARKLGMAFIRGRTYEIYFCFMCKRRVLVRARLVRPMTTSETERYAREVEVEAKRLNG